MPVGAVGAVGNLDTRILEQVVIVEAIELP